MNTANLYRAQQLAIAAAIDSGNYDKACDLARQDIRTFAEPEQIETGDKRTLTPRRKCGIIKAIRRYVRRKRKIKEEKKMKKYMVREYRAARDGSEYITESYEITEAEYDETVEGLDELTGTAIDRYEIEKL